MFPQPLSRYPTSLIFLLLFVKQACIISPFHNILLASISSFKYITVAVLLKLIISAVLYPNGDTYYVCAARSEYDDCPDRYVEWEYETSRIRCHFIWNGSAVRASHTHSFSDSGVIRNETQQSGRSFPALSSLIPVNRQNATYPRLIDLKSMGGDGKLRPCL